jgi:hypothetical protein
VGLSVEEQSVLHDLWLTFYEQGSGVVGIVIGVVSVWMGVRIVRGHPPLFGIRRVSPWWLIVGGVFTVLMEIAFLDGNTRVV